MADVTQPRTASAASVRIPELPAKSKTENSNSPTIHDVNKTSEATMRPMPIRTDRVLIALSKVTISFILLLLRLFRFNFRIHYSIRLVRQYSSLFVVFKSNLAFNQCVA